MSLENEQVFDKNIINPLLVSLIEQAINSAIAEMKNEQESSTCYTQKIEIELITINECTKLIPGISYYTVRQLAEQNKIKSFRTGQGKRGKILIYKDSFFKYFTEEIS